MYLERIRAENVRHLQAVEHVFSTEAQDLRRWTLLREGKAATALLRCVALVNIGRWQMSQLMARVAPLLASDPDHPARLEFVLIQHAPQERGPQGSVQRQYGWRLHADGRAEALRRRTLHTQTPGARPGRVELGHSQTGRLLLGYGGTLDVGTDGFDPAPDQRWRRCASLFSATSAATDPVAYLERLFHKRKYRSGRARTVLKRLNEALRPWLGWSVTQRLAKGELDSQWSATPPSRRIPAVVAVDIARLRLQRCDERGKIEVSSIARQPVPVSALMHSQDQHAVTGIVRAQILTEQLNLQRLHERIEGPILCPFHFERRDAGPRLLDADVRPLILIDHAFLRDGVTLARAYQQLRCKPGPEAPLWNFRGKFVAPP